MIESYMRCPSPGVPYNETCKTKGLLPMRANFIGLICLIASFSYAGQASSADQERKIDDLIARLAISSMRGTDVEVSTDGDKAEEELKAIGRPAIPKLILALSSDKNWTRLRAAECLGGLKAAEASGALTKAIALERELGIRGVMLVALGSTGGSGALKTLIENSKNENVDVRDGAVEGLANIEDERAIPTLMDHLADKSMIGIPSAQLSLNYLAAHGLARLGSRCLKRLETVFSSPDPDVQDAVCEALAGMNNQEASTFLLENFKGKKIGPILRSLHGNTDPRFTPVLLDLMDSPDWQVRITTASILGEHARESDLPRLRTILVGVVQFVSTETNSHSWEQLVVSEIICDAFLRLHDTKAKAVCQSLLSSLDGRKDYEPQMREILQKVLWTSFSETQLLCLNLVFSKVLFSSRTRLSE
jgi:HEAT repeat protein